MIETPETDFRATRGTSAVADMTALGLRAWFIREVFPLETVLMQFLRHNWRNESEIADLRQDVYLRVYEAAKAQLPDPVRPFVFTIAKNLIVDRVRKEQVVSIEAIADLDALEIATDAPGPERSALARDELRRLQSALDCLPPRCREALVLARVDGLSGREIAERMSITESTVSHYLKRGVQCLANVLQIDPRELPRKP
ncbi:MAG TPA: RNA polymerase sigma factor [Rhizomicrobium sp.]